jgi:hypothetical protein
MRAFALGLLAVGALLAGCLLLVETSAPSSQRLVAQDKKDVEAADHPGLNADYCRACHLGPDSADNWKRWTKEKRTDFIRCNEFKYFEQHDLHFKAHDNIVPRATGGPDGGPNLAWVMEQALAKSPDRKNLPDGKTYRVNQAAECLTCHALDRYWQWDKRENQFTTMPVNCRMIDDGKSPRFFQDSFGVNCQACHGIVTEDWRDAHVVRTWRNKKPLDKLTEEGQIDLRDPRLRAERCASCHVGNKREGKFVTHDMYAAGHPPLPAFELAAYGYQQPAHYYPSRDNKYFKDQLAEKAENAASLFERFNYRKDELAAVRAIAYGAVTAYRSWLSLLQDDQADPKAPAKKEDGAILDFAHFDCAACHHDLKADSERQKRSGGITGRPTMKTKTDLLDIVLKHAARVNANDPNEVKMAKAELDRLRLEYAQKNAKLKELFVARPFGDKGPIQTTARELEATLAKLLAGLRPIVYDRANSQRLLDDISALLRDLGKKEETVDHDAAQELTWAALVLRHELSGTDKKAPDTSGKIEGQFEPNLADDPDARAINEWLGVVLRNPYGKDPLESVEKRLRDRLQKQYKFQSSGFLKAMNALPKLPAAGP